MKNVIEEKTKLKRFKVSVDLFETDVHVWFGDIIESAKDAEKWSHGRIEFDMPNYGLAFWGTNDNGIFYGILIANELMPDTVTHECLHIAWNMLENFGVEVDVENHEMLAYLQEYIAHKIFMKLDRILGLKV